MRAFRTFPGMSSIAPPELYVCTWLGQRGGGLNIWEGRATLTNTNVYKNRATSVCLLLHVSLNLHPATR